MAEYIERSAVFEQFDNADADVCETDDFGGVDYGFGMKNIKELINAIPTADVAPVVRCKDCKHSWEDISGLCCSHGVCVDLNVPGDFYCAYGKRKDVGDRDATD